VGRCSPPAFGGQQMGRMKSAGPLQPRERTLAIRGSKNQEWWKDQEQLGFLFERAFRPLQQVHRNTMQRDIVGVLRQLDVGIIEKGQKAVSAFVEIQKRAGKVGMQDFGNWIYKMQTLAAKELVALSEAGFTQPVVKHVRQLHANSVKLARIYQLADGKIEKPNTEFMGFLGAIENKWDSPRYSIKPTRTKSQQCLLGMWRRKFLISLKEARAYR
jgi:hypothetical protein